MNIVFLSPHFPPNFYRFCVQLRQLGGNVLGIADAPWEELRPELRESLSGYYRTNMGDYGQILRAGGYFTHLHGKLDRVESHNEYWLETEARLREDFNIDGFRPDSIANVTLKARMKQGFQKAGVAVARGTVVATLQEAQRFAAEIGFPAVLKPDRGVGAASTFRVNDGEELQRVFAQKLPVNYIMEEFIQGVIHSFDGLTDRAGNIVFCASHVFSQGIMETVNEDGDIFYYSQREIPADLEAAGRAAVRAFGIREKFFHLEFFRTEPDGRIVAIEVNMRPPGGLTMDMFNYANDIDLYRQWAHVVLHNQFTAKYERPYHCAYIGRKSRKSYAHNHEQIMGAFGRMIVHHEPINSVFSAALGDFGYLARSAELEELLTLGRFIQAAQ
ncbi:MAG: ATP-grasp domain-containing protein [Trichloromonadaceae bacterium]